MRIRQWLIGIVMLIAGLAVSVQAGNFVSNHWATHPSVHDIVLEHIPYVNLFFIGEMLYWLVLATYLLLYIRYQRAQIPYILCLVGIYYLLRSLFLILLPIGHPFSAPEYGERWSAYPQFAYFPSGHLGFLTIITLGLGPIRFHRWFWLLVFFFGVGMIITRAHYTVDILGAVVIAYAVYSFAEKHLRSRWFKSL